MNISFQTNFHVVLLIWVEKSTVMLPKQQLLLTLQTRAFELLKMEIMLNDQDKDGKHGVFLFSTTNFKS